jgi:hypothetical protein
MSLQPRRHEPDRYGSKEPEMETRKTITLELVLSGDGFSGRAHSDDGLVREFSGRLGLMHTIDELLAPAGTTKTTRSGPAARGGPAQGRESK